MGSIAVEATIKNLEDLWAVRRGILPAEQARKVVVADGLVDTGATLLSLPTRVIQALGLQPVSRKRVLSNTGTATEANVYDAVRLTVKGRSCTMDAAGQRPRVDRPDSAGTPRFHHRHARPRIDRQPRPRRRTHV